MGDNVGFQRRGRQNAAGFLKTRGRRSWFPKWETRLVQRVGDKAGQRLVKGWSKTKLIFNKFLIFFLNENKEEWYRRESKSGNFILEDNYGG